jgi:hypothetical protein
MEGDVLLYNSSSASWPICATPSSPCLCILQEYLSSLSKMIFRRLC